MPRRSDVACLAHMRAIARSFMCNCDRADAPPAARALEAIVAGAAEGARDVLTGRAIYSILQQAADRVAAEWLDDVGAAEAQPARKPR